MLGSFRTIPFLRTHGAAVFLQNSQIRPTCMAREAVVQYRALLAKLTRWVSKLGRANAFPVQSGPEERIHHNLQTIENKHCLTKGHEFGNPKLQELRIPYELFSKF